MPDDPNEQVKTPEQIAAEAAQAEADKKAKDAADMAKAISTGVADALAAREAATKKAEPAAVVIEPPIENVDPAEIDRLIAEGKPVAHLLVKFGASVEERTRRAVLAETGGAVQGVQEVVLDAARKGIKHFTEYEDEIIKIVNRVSPARRTLKVYQDATAMVLGRPEVHDKLVEAEVATVLSRRKESAGAAETGGASRIVKPAGTEHQQGELAPTEENLRTLVGDDAYREFAAMKSARGWTLDSFAQRQGYADAKVWFRRMQENDARSLNGELDMDLNWVRDDKGNWVKDEPWVTGISR